MTNASRTGAGGFDDRSFSEFIDARLGTGDAVYYYGVGDMLSFPKFEPVARLETIEVVKLYPAQDQSRVANQLSRRLLRFLDPLTGDVLTDDQGRPRADFSLDSQHVVYRLNDKGFVQFEGRQNSGPHSWSFTGGEATEFNRLGDMGIATLPVTVSTGEQQYWETQEYLIHPEGNPEPRFQSTWYWYGTAPEWVDTATCSMHGHQWRYDRSEDLPENIREFLNGDGTAWAEPPSSPADVS
jgi:hypothetical protein